MWNWAAFFFLIDKYFSLGSKKHRDYSKRDGFLFFLFSPEASWVHIHVHSDKCAYPEMKISWLRRLHALDFVAVSEPQKHKIFWGFVDFCNYWDLENIYMSYQYFSDASSSRYGRFCCTLLIILLLLPLGDEQCFSLLFFSCTSFLPCFPHRF